MHARSHDGSNELEHQFEPPCKLAGKIDFVRAPEEQAQQHHVCDMVVIPERLLTVDAIGAVLLYRFRFQLASCTLPPARGLRPEGPGHCRHEQPHQFAEQMIVGRRVTRQVSRYEVAVLIDCDEPALPERLTLLRSKQRRILAAQQMPGTGPIDEAHRRLERDRPLRTPGIGTLLKPGQQQATLRFGEARFAREMPCLRQSHEFQMAVQLPEILDVANDTLIPIIDALPEFQRYLPSGSSTPIPPL